MPPVSVLFYNTNHLFYGIESILLHVRFNSIDHFQCHCRIVEICRTHRYCTGSCKNKLNCILCAGNSAHSDDRDIDCLCNLINHTDSNRFHDRSGNTTGFICKRKSLPVDINLHSCQCIDQGYRICTACFRTFCGVELTPSMVSNYVKKGILSHPVKKKYTRDQIASLLYIVVSKTVLSMENIETLFKMQKAYCSAGAAYDTFCEELERCLPFVFGCTRALPDPDPDAADEKLLLRSTILAAANKMYLDCCFDALRQEQNLWADILPDLA